MYEDRDFVSSFVAEMGSAFAAPITGLLIIVILTSILSGYPTKKQIIYSEQSILADVTMESGFTLEGFVHKENVVVKLYLENSNVPFYVGTLKDGKVSNNNMLTDLAPGTYTCNAELIKNYTEKNEAVFMLPEDMTLTVY